MLVKGLNILGATVSTPLSAPVIAATRLRKGGAGSARGAASLATEAVGTARACGCAGTIVVRMDSGYYSSQVIAAIRGADAHFSVTVPSNPSTRRVIAEISEDAWTPIRYPHAIRDGQANAWVSGAGVAEITYAAPFTSKKKEERVTARLIVRRVRALNPKAAPGQGELFPDYRYHAALTGSPFVTLQAEDQHREPRRRGTTRAAGAASSRSAPGRPRDRIRPGRAPVVVCRRAGNSTSMTPRSTGR